MREITKEEFLELLESGEIVGLEIQQMKPAYLIPVKFFFLGINEDRIRYLLTNKNPNLARIYDEHEVDFSLSSFISDVKYSTGLEYFILNQNQEPDWRV